MVFKYEQRWKVGIVRLDSWVFDIENNQRKEVYYWRKHYGLHEWMRDLWEMKSKNPKNLKEFASAIETKNLEEFHCVYLNLVLEDIEQYENDIKNVEYDRKEEDLEFIQKAKKELNNGKELFYYSQY